VSFLPTKILLATDGSEEATLAARAAADIVDKTSSELHIVYAEPLPPVYGEFPTKRFEIREAVKKEVGDRAQRILDDQVKQIEAGGVTVAQAHLRIGRPDEEIVSLGEEIGTGLVVMGSRGLDRIRRTLMGSVADSVVRHAHCPVLVVRKEKPEEAAGPHAEVELI
jgi:nucleotide-binding universal stress UspA family protein